MCQQLSFFRASQPSFDNRSLILVLFPGEAKAAIHQLGSTLNDTHHLRGSLRPPKQLHMTLHGLGGWSERTIRASGKACAAAATKVAPFTVHLDRVMKWPSSRALVLTESPDGNVTLKQCHKRLSLELAREIGLKKISSSFTPHVTMLYCDRNIAPESVMPIEWTANEIVLICSYQGKTKYEPLGCWPLKG